MTEYHWTNSRRAAQKTMWAKENEATYAWHAFMKCYAEIDTYFNANPTFSWAAHYCVDSASARQTLRHIYLIYATDTMDGVRRVLHNTNNIDILNNFEWVCLPYLFFQAQGNKDVLRRPLDERGPLGVTEDTKNEWKEPILAASCLAQVEWVRNPDETRGQLRGTPGDLPKEWFDESSQYAWLTHGRRTEAQRFVKTKHVITREDLTLPQKPAKGKVSAAPAKGKVSAAPVAVVAAAPVAVAAGHPSHHTYVEPPNIRVVRHTTSKGGGGGVHGFAEQN